MGRKTPESGQTIVLFAMVLVAVVAMVGLVIDGGATYGQRRGEQNAADLAALAGGTALINGQDPAAAALAVTAANGYPVGGDVAVSVTFPVTGQVKVDITAPHRNYFAGIVGQSRWNVSVTATALASIQPDTATGALPMLFSTEVFGAEAAKYNDPAHPFTWDHGTSGGGDAPADGDHVAWTLLDISAAGGNLDDARLKNLINGDIVVTMTAQFNAYLGQHNNGQKAAAFGEVADLLPADGSGRDFVVPIVGPPTVGTTCLDGSHTDGCFLGWGVVHIISASQGGKSVTGYFVSGFARELSYSGSCTPTTCPKNVGGYSLRLVN